MNLSDAKYSRFSLVQEMMHTPEVVERFDPESTTEFLPLAKSGRVFLTGEGSSRIFPAKNLIYTALRNGYDATIVTDGAAQAMEYDLAEMTVFVASNSGKTKEGVALIRHLKERGHAKVCGVIANAGTPIEEESDSHYLLTCGPEQAVAATKSVVEQALFYDVLFRRAYGKALPDFQRLADAMRKALQAPIPEEMAGKLHAATTLYWAGRNNGVAEELTLKSNEITRKKSDYLEGTYAVHGIEEVMQPTDIVVLVSPFPSEQDKFKEVLEKGVGLPVFAIDSASTPFPTFEVQAYPEFQPYIELAAGWNLLVEIGVRLGINLDKAERARKVGNEFVG